MADTTGGPSEPDTPATERPVPEEHVAYAPPGALGTGPITPPPPGPTPRAEGPDYSFPPAGQIRRPADDIARDRPARTERGGITRRTLALVAVLAGLLGATIAAIAVAILVDPGEAPETVIERVETQIVSADAEGLPTATAVARRVVPSIVTVEVGTGSGGSFVTEGSGSGVVLDADEQLLVTNQHVVDGASNVRVVFADGRAYEAELVGEDALTDLAVVRIDTSGGLTAVELGAADELEIGDTAIAVGSPLGLQGGPSVTVGVVSAFDRRVRTNGNSELFGMLQTDAPINRGSSGGALVDAEGRLIGITTAIGVSDAGAEGLGFAIPVEMVVRITDELIERGEVRHAFLGITGSTFFEEAPDGASIPSGVVVASVLDDTAAAEAGLQAGDIIRSFDGERVVTMDQLVVGLRFYRVGDTVSMEIDRGGETRTLELTLLARPENV
ncbi:MAG: trypsin-like peptidase domain-containing protein [Acidimicrobiia bacterium]|nr:trypsin-like peptidase domain-containing protein [Acidimicrobiia bacterium]